MLVGWAGLVGLPLAAEEPTVQALLAQQIQRLETSTIPAKRLEALELIFRHGRNEHLEQVIAALQRCLKRDAEASVRCKAVEVLGVLVYQRQPRICPRAVAERLLDPDADVRSVASGVAGMYRQWNPGSVAVCHRCCRSAEPSIRSNGAFLLANAAGKQQDTLAVVRAMTHDPHFEVRTSASAARFTITHRLEDIVPYYIRIRQEVTEPLPEGRPLSEAEKVEQCHKHLMVLGAGMRLQEWAIERTDELAPILVRLGDDDSSLMRFGAADFLRSLAGGYALLLRQQNDAGAPHVPSFEGLPPPGFQPAESREQRLERLGKAMARMRANGVSKTLQRLAATDPSPRVRAAAAEALQCLAALAAR